MGGACLKVLDLFSGIGGFSLGLERAGMQTIAFCEIEPFCRKVLDKWWPSIPVWEDIRTLNYCLRRVLTSSAAASRARIYQQPAKVPELPDPVRDSGGRCYEPFAWYDRDSRLWRTWQRCFIEGWAPFSENWPKAGMTRNGVAYRLLMSEPPTYGKESGLWVQTPTRSMSSPSKKLRNDGSHRLPTPKEAAALYYERNGKKWPTPNTRDYRSDGEIRILAKNCNTPAEYQAMSNQASSKKRAKYFTPTVNDSKNATLPLSQGVRDSLIGDLIRDGCNGSLNPGWVEWLMGFPIGWTALKDLEIPLSRRSRKSSEIA